jgi:hypothetical protein
MKGLAFAGRSRGRILVFLVFVLSLLLLLSLSADVYAFVAPLLFFAEILVGLIAVLEPSSAAAALHLPLSARSPPSR